MDPSAYPPALGGLFFSTDRRMFSVAPVTVRTAQNSHTGTAHSHDFLQFWYTVSGSYAHRVNGATTMQTPGSAVLIFPYMTHSINIPSAPELQPLVIVISVKKNALEALGVPFQNCSCQSACFDAHLLPGQLTFQGAEKAMADAICLELLAEYSKNQQMNTYKLLTLTTEFLTLCVSGSGHALSAAALRRARDRYGCIDEALTFLGDNYSKNLTLDEISRSVMMSRRSFTAGFQAVTGQSCGDYLRHLRMKQAVELLRKTPKSINEIAEACGFYDSSHFCKVCIELYGTSPLTLRRELSQWTRNYGDAIYQQTMREMAWAVSFDEDSRERHRCAMSFY